jgi:predicted glutamine amidotransferase
MVSASAKDAYDHLVSHEFSLLAQSDFDQKRIQKDGWGIGSWHGRTWKVVRSSGAVFKEKKAFERASRESVSRIVLAHLREASNPRGLSHRTLISLNNTQPFQSGRYLFMHNGVLTIPLEVSAILGPYRKNLKGTNDSEVLFWTVMRNIKRLGNVPKAFSRSVEDLWSVWEKCDESTRERASKLYDRKAPYFGLNCIISDGRTLWAFCKHDKASPHKDLCGRGRPVFEICHTTRGDATYVASERTDRAKDWKFMRDGMVLTVRTINPKEWHLSEI